MPLQIDSARLAALAFAALLAGCGEMKIKVWPLAGDTAIQERSRSPANATEYLCTGGKRIYLRRLDGGDAVWLILPEREVRLDRIGTEGSRYGKGAMVLQLTGNDATLNDGAATPVTGCKTGAAEPAAPAADSANK